ncbi:sigma-70 family RNA polymerase sigma factor [Sphingomonas oryzagri]|uniref:Sigma-70 family RNA polymerase sigma factor n=1 Tax=Sphingomonas oryzagri TaxID=3042314 RepID=A0ABT6N3K5_9SPHN|nr:sigma-70 family RNA polymerase sigma factor [Sphingomonas oryzagri]MDH7639348.1 sigma-70 family RNA polymerase sigma factor [Sphingomonas oryzagri]
MGSTNSDMAAASLAATLQRVGAGDRAAFEEVYRRTSVKLFGVCLRILPVRQEAEEALQEAYLSVWRRAGSFDGTKGSAMTWLITLTRNRAVDRLRGSGKFAAGPIELADEVPDPAPAASTMLETGEDERRLAYCLDTLGGGDAQLIRTAFFEGSTYAELADRASTPLGTIKSRIRRALLKLRDCLR